MALAVAAEGRETVTKDLNTGCGTDRQANMQAFATEALKLAKEVVVAQAKI